MTKYYDIYTQIPGIKPCPQMWVTAEDKIDIIDQFLHKRDFIVIQNIVATDVKELFNTETLICRTEMIRFAVWTLEPEGKLKGMGTIK